MPANRLLAAIMVSFAGASAADYQTPSFSADGVVNAATGQPGIAPYSICTIYGTNLFLDGVASASGGTQIPGPFSGISVLIGPIPAGVFYVSSNQVNLLIPNSLTPGTYSVTVVRDGIASCDPSQLPACKPVSIAIQEVSPGLFASSPGVASATHMDGSPVNTTSPASPGEIVTLWATGLGRTQPDQTDRLTAQSAAPIVHLVDFQVLLDGAPVDPSRVQYAGVTPHSAGLYQVNVKLPNDLSQNNPEVRFSLAGSMSPTGLHLPTAPVQAAQP